MNKPNKILYRAEAKAMGGCNGRAVSSDHNLEVKLSVPKEMGGDGQGTNPEQLFAAGFSACFLGALKFVAGTENMTLPADTTVTGQVGIGPTHHGLVFAAKLSISLPGIERSRAEALVQKIEVTLEVV